MQSKPLLHPLAGLAPALIWECVSEPKPEPDPKLDPKGHPQSVPAPAVPSLLPRLLSGFKDCRAITERDTAAL